MNSKLQAIFIVGLSIFPGFCFGYEVATHENLSTEAYAASDLQKDPSVQDNLGLNPSNKFPNSHGAPKTIVELIQDGANFEDDSPRPANHFYNPLNDQPLTTSVFTADNTSPSWALEDFVGISGQDFSYRDARQYLYDALTSPAKDDREKNFGLTFQTIGQVIHHIQDMAQPQHVRNDLTPIKRTPS